MEEPRLGKIGGERVGTPVRPNSSGLGKVQIMRRKLRHMALAGLLAIAALVGLGTTPVQAQGYGYYPRAYGGAAPRAWYGGVNRGYFVPPVIVPGYGGYGGYNRGYAHGRGYGRHHHRGGRRF